MIEALGKYQQGESGKEYEHKPEELTKERVATKLKAVHKKYRNAVDTGRRSGQGRVIMLQFDLCEQIWGGSPATTKINNAIETSSINDDETSESVLSSNSTSIEGTADDGNFDFPDTENVVPTSFSTSTLPKTSSDTKKRRALLDDCLTNYKKKKLEKKVSLENQLLEYANQENEFRKEFLQQQKEADEDYKKTMASLSGTMAEIGKSISDGFASLRYLMQSQQQPMQNSGGWESNGNQPFIPRQIHPNMQYQGFQFMADNIHGSPESEF